MLEASFFISSKEAFSLDHEFKLMAIFQLLCFIVLCRSSIFQHITLIDDNKIIKVVFGIHLDGSSVFNGMEGSDQIIVFCVVLNVPRISLLHCFYVIQFNFNFPLLFLINFDAVFQSFMRKLEELVIALVPAGTDEIVLFKLSSNKLVLNQLLIIIFYYFDGLAIVNENFSFGVNLE